MIKNDEDELICDLAETYGIYDYRSLPPRTVATLTVGLREDSRVRAKRNGWIIPPDWVVRLGIFDLLKWIQWSKTKDGSRNRNLPDSWLEKSLHPVEEEKELSFESKEEFEAARKRMLEEM